MKKTLFKNLALSMAALLTLSVAHANPVTVNNFSFEQDVVTTGPDTAVSFFTGWTLYNRAGGGDFGSQLPGTDEFATGSANGNQFLYENEFNTGTTGGLFQDVGALQANTTYTLTVAIGSRGDRINSPGIISLINAASGGLSFSGTGVLTAGSVDASGGGLPGTQSTWQDFTATFTTGASVSGDLYVNLSVAGAGTIQADFDNVRLDATAVPEPSTYALLGGGLALLAFVVLRRKQVSLS